tara:strand:- start:1010 stop:1549 length:540 start_codon:yes stop_codon:yes gene_type:complete
MDYAQNNIKQYLSVLIQDSELHGNIGPKLNENNILEAESELGIALPQSFKLFLKEFGNGADWLYHVDQPINGVAKEYGKIHWLGKYRKHLGETIESNGFGSFKTKTLLCLMTENSNGGAWVFLTSENSENGEWPLAFYNMDDQKLYFKVESFTQWIGLAIKCKSEVIRELDEENILNLG